MAIKTLRPTTPTQRWATVSSFEEITKTNPERRLCSPLKSSAGRNNRGKITMRRRGGGHKRHYRIIDFKRDKDGVPACVQAIEYDPNRSARIALLAYADGEKRYILAPLGLKVGDRIMSGPDAPISPGNALPLQNIPLGMALHNIELARGKGGQIARGAGSQVQLMAKEGRWAHLKLPSGEIRVVDVTCYATVGQVGNLDHEIITVGKAGRSRWLGKRPKVRGAAMNPIDHPQGGGEGKSKGGRPPMTPWGKPTKGYKTRKPNKKSDDLIVRRRK